MRRARSRRMFSEMDVADRGAVYRPVWMMQITGVLLVSPCLWKASRVKWKRPILGVEWRTIFLSKALKEFTDAVGEKMNSVPWDYCLRLVLLDSVMVKTSCASFLLFPLICSLQRIMGSSLVNKETNSFLSVTLCSFFLALFCVKTFNCKSSFSLLF